jgi:nucleotide-binding universal stress UspA family protein
MVVEVIGMSATTALLTLAATWVGVGVLLALIMGRHGHDPFAWWLLGILLGPLALPLAVSADRQGERAWLVRAERPGRGPVDVLVGLDGSPEAAAALAAALDLLGPELERQGRLAQLRLSTGEHSLDDAWAPALVLAAGRPADVLSRLAAEGGYDLLVVGGRGTGLSKVLLGSTATTLAAKAKVPVLVAEGGSSSTWSG